MRKGFTLAEVLITLGIIGVVAALVMPSLIANYKKKVWVVQLQKEISVWDNAMKLMLATDGVEYFNDTEFAKSVIDAGQNSFSSSDAHNLTKSKSEDILKKYLKIVKFTYNEDFVDAPDGYYCVGMLSGDDGGCTDGTLPAYMADGSAYGISFSNLNASSTENLLNGNISIDVNGKNGPNRYGRDVFSFYVNRYGQLVPRYSQQAADYGWYYGYYWRNFIGACGTPGSSDVSTNVYGDGCAARIIENGWVMDY